MSTTEALPGDTPRVGQPDTPGGEGGIPQRRYAIAAVKLPAGRYIVRRIHPQDDAPVLRIGDAFTLSAPTDSVRHAGGRYWQILSWDDDATHAESTWVTAVDETQ